MINNKLYIGQTVNPTKRWSGHKNQAKKEVPGMVINKAMKKYGIDNFTFDVISSVLSTGNKIEDCKRTDEIEALCIIQFNSLASNGNGYNISLGGETAPKSQEWIQKMKDHWADPVWREKQIKILKDSGACYQPGHAPSDESIAKISETKRSHNLHLSEDQKQQISNFHKGKQWRLGQKQSEEETLKKSQSLLNFYDQKLGDQKCSVDGCEQLLRGRGNSAHRIVNGSRYCNMHGLRLERHGSTDAIKKVAHNKLQFTPEQIISIKADERPARAIAKDYGVSAHPIWDIKRKAI